MKITFLGQGFLPDANSPVGEYLMRFLLEDDFHSFFGFSAFASEAGIVGLSDHFQKANEKFEHLNLVVGVDQKGTSKEALNAILALGINSFIFYQPAFPIFHPKIYLFEGEKYSELIIGSSNLTMQGLFVNVEASLLVSIENKLEEDLKVLSDLKSYFKGLFDQTDPNLQPLTEELIEELVAKGIVPTEVERTSNHDKLETKEKDTTWSLIAKLFPRRAIAKVAKEFRKVRKPRIAAQPVTALAPPKPHILGELVWAKYNLPKSDVQIPQVERTKPTGGLRLTQAKFLREGKEIDDTKYFRDLFSDYKWIDSGKKTFVEIAIVPFEITIRENYIGKFNLVVRHKPSGDAGQNNYTTSISWGSVGDTIRDAYLVGANLELYAPATKGDPFQIIFH